MEDSIDPKKPKEGQESFDVLNGQKEQEGKEPPSGIHDFAEIPIRRPTDIDPLPDLPLNEPVPVNSERTEDKPQEQQKEHYKVSPSLLAYIESLRTEGRQIGWLVFSLKQISSKEDAVDLIDRYYHEEHLLHEDEYETMLGYLGESKLAVEKVEDYILPEKLIGYLEEISRTKPELEPIVKTLKEKGDSKEEAEYWLKLGLISGYLSEEEHKKASDILNVEAETKPTPSTEKKQEEPVVETKLKEEIIPEPKPEEINPIDVELAKTRLEYARVQIEYENKNSKREKIKNLIGNLYSSEKSGIQKEKSPLELELEETKKRQDEALSEYIKAKKRKTEDILSSPITEEEKKRIDPDLKMSDEERRVAIIKYRILEQAEKEWDVLQGEKDELKGASGNERIKKIKEITRKGLQVWSRVPLKARLIVAPALIGLGVGATAGLGIGAVYAGSRLVRGVAGAVGARGVGSWYTGKTEKINEEARKEYTSAYQNGASGELFEEKEKEYMQARELEQKRKKAQAVKKALLMAGAGAGAGILAGLAESSIEGALSSGVTPIPPKTFDGVLEKSKAFSPAEVHTHTPAVDILATKVGLSSQGYLQDIHNLKAQIIRQYGENIPPEIKANIMDKPTVEIAKDYGFYKPGDPSGNSAMGFAGEKLSVDTNGRLVLEHTNGTKDFLSSTETGDIKPFEGKMFNPEEIPKKPTPVIDDSVPESVPKPAPESVQEPLPSERLEVKLMTPIEPQESTISTPMPGPETIKPEINESVARTMDVAGTKVAVFNGVEIAHEHVLGKYKMLMLDDKFQDGAQYVEARRAFVDTYENYPMSTDIKELTEVPFEGGKIYLMEDPAGIKVLLNGKEIATGYMKTQGSSVGMKLSLDPNLKTGWIMKDSVYERAFKYLSKSLAIRS